MPTIRITDADIDAEAERRGTAPADLTSRDRQHIKRDLATAEVDARKPPAEPAGGPDHLTVTVEITHGDDVLGVTQTRVAIPKGTPA